MFRRALLAVGGSGLAAMAVVGFLIAPKPLPASALAARHTPDLANGAAMFDAGNCAACHMAPGQDDRTRLAGGLKLRSSFGVFVTPNISPDARFGIGAWSELEFANAMKRGVGRGGEHLYPAFPYPAYSLMRTADVRDLFAYLKTLPPVATPSAPHALKFPFDVRTALGVWKLLYFRPHEFAPDPRRPAAWNRGAYLAEGPAHCAECHSPRDALGGIRPGRLYSGAPSLEAGGRFASNITPSRDGVGDWTEQDMADFLKSGQDKCFNEPTGMRDVVAATSRMSDADLAAIAAYLHTLPPIAGNGRRKTC